MAFFELKALLVNFLKANSVFLLRVEGAQQKELHPSKNTVPWSIGTSCFCYQYCIIHLLSTKRIFASPHNPLAGPAVALISNVEIESVGSSGFAYQALV